MAENQAAGMIKKGCLITVLVCAGILVGLVILGMVLSGGKPIKPKPQEAVAQNVETAPEPQKPAKKQISSGSAGPKAAADAAAFYRLTLSTIQACDASGAKVADVAGRGDAIALYRAADDMEQNCFTANRKVKELPIPRSVGTKAISEFGKGKEVCADAAAAKWLYAQKMKKALDNPGLVSGLAELEKAGEYSQSATFLCVATLMEPAVRLGAKEKDLALPDQ